MTLSSSLILLALEEMRRSKLTCHLLQGTSDVVYSVANAEEEIKLFVNSPDAKLVTVDQGQHFLSFSHPTDVDQNLIDFVGKWNQ